MSLNPKIQNFLENAECQKTYWKRYYFSKPVKIGPPEKFDPPQPLTSIPSSNIQAKGIIVLGNGRQLLGLGRGVETYFEPALKNV